MRALRSEAELADLPSALRSSLAACLERWRTAGAPCDPDGEFLLLVEPGDDLAAICARVLPGIEDDDCLAIAEWTTDWGTCFETYVCFSDDGCGLSLVTPKLPGIDANLLALCSAYARPLD